MLILRRRIQEKDTFPYAIQSYDATLPNYNTIAMTVMYNAGLSAESDRMTMAEAAAVTNATMPSFKNNTNLTEFDEFVNFTGITTISYELFRGATNLEHLSFPPLVTIVGTYAFMMCKKLQRIENFAAKTINAQAFNTCTLLDGINLTDIYISGTYIFCRCSNLTGTIKMAEGWNGRLESNVFNYCAKINVIDFPSTWTYGLEAKRFYNMNDLSHVILRNPTPSSQHVFSQFNANVLFYVPAEGLAAYQSLYPDYASRFRAI